MSNPAPVLRLRGTVHSDPVLNPVPGAEALPEQRDAETGRLIRAARPAREGYDKYDVSVLTEGGGFVTLVIREEALAKVEGWMPAKGEQVDLPVYGYVAYRGEAPRRFAVPGYSLAGEVLAAERRASTSTGSRVAAVS